MKKVSIIIPVYKAENYVAMTIQSLLDQTYENLEILIVDDGSPDRSIDICRRFSDPRIRIIQQQNRGLAGARNTGIRHATGEYIGFLDADDIWLPAKVEKHVQHLNSSPHIGISFSYSAFIDADGRYTGAYQIPRRIHNITPAYALCRNPIGNGSSLIIRRETLEAIQFQDNLRGFVEDCYFDESFQRAEDLECWVRISTQTHWEQEGIPEVLTLYRIISSGLSANVMKQFEALERVIDQSCNASPAILGPYRNLARAYYMRYVSRRAVTLHDGNLAVEMMNRALITNWKILIEEPKRTMMTIGAAYFVKFTPISMHKKIESLALKITGKIQQQQLLNTKYN